MTPLDLDTPRFFLNQCNSSTNYCSLSKTLQNLRRVTKIIPFQFKPIPSGRFPAIYSENNIWVARYVLHKADKTMNRVVPEQREAYQDTEIQMTNNDNHNNGLTKAVVGKSGDGGPNCPVVRTVRETAKC